MRATRTYLELTDRAQFRAALGDFPGVTVAHVPPPGPAPELYRQCYRTVGEAFRLRDRWDWSDARIAAHLADPNIRLYVARRGGALAGWYELRRAEDDSVEIAYFGIVAAEFGRGFGKHLLSCAVRDAWALEPPPRRVSLHTCTLEHSNAL